jgi:hypothetical protein
MLNFNHLKEAAQANGIAKNKLATYLWHLMFSIRQSILLFVMATVSIIHGFFPFLFDFWLMETYINMLDKLKKQFPNYPRFKE